MNLNTILFDQIGRLRSGFRIAAFLALFILMAGSLSIILASVIGSMNIGVGEGSLLASSVNSLVIIVSALVCGWLCGKLLEKDLPFRYTGAWFTKGWLKHLIYGCVLGTAAFTIAVAAAAAFGGLSLTLNPEFGTASIPVSVLSAFVIFAFGAALEEALFRGYVLQTLVRSGWVWLGIAITAIPFGIVHLGNPDAKLISTLNTVLAGVWLGIAYLKTRDLWFVWGMHLAWNWVQNSIFGIEVSGLNFTSSPLLKEIDRGPEWMTGLNYGLEGGISVTVALIVAILLTHYAPGIKPDEELIEFTNGSSKINPSES